MGTLFDFKGKSGRISRLVVTIVFGLALLLPGETYSKKKTSETTNENQAVTDQQPQKSTKKDKEEAKKRKKGKKEEDQGQTSQGDATEEGELATVAIVPFLDQTGSNNYSYMPESLVDAIDISLAKNFRYERVAKRRVKLAVDKVMLDEKNRIAEKNRKQSQRKKDKKDKENGDQAEGSEDQPDQFQVVKEISKILPADIVIYGHYHYDLETDELVIQVEIYLGLVNAKTALPEVRNKVDSSLFSVATEKVAQVITDEINRMIAEHEKAGPDKGEKEEEPPGTRKAITKKVATGRYDWGKKKVMISAIPMFSFLPASKSGVGNDGTEFNIYTISGGQVQIRLNLWPKIYTGLSVANMYREYQYYPANQPGFNNSLEFFSAHVILGYRSHYKKLLFYTELQGGYYIGNYQFWINDTSYRTPFRNPSAAARAGTEFLLLPILSIGVSLNYNFYWDLPKPMMFLSISPVVNLVF